MYPGGKIWDLTPEGGGPPVEVIVGNPNEAIAAHPERYTRKAPDGTVQAAIAKRDRDRAAMLAKIDEEARAKSAEIEQKRQAKLAEIAKGQAEAKKAALEKDRAAATEEAAKSGAVPDRSAEVAAVNAEADGLHALAQHEAEEKKKAALAAPSAPVEVKPAAAHQAPKQPDPRHHGRHKDD